LVDDDNKSSADVAIEFSDNGVAVPTGLHDDDKTQGVIKNDSQIKVSFKLSSTVVPNNDIDFFVHRLSQSQF
jgi:selenocysteine lyase/cysteine desulfurase